MAEYVGGEPMAVGVGDPITFENKTDDNFSVGVGIVFRKSGLYRVSVDDKYTSVEIEPEREKGKWVDNITDVDFDNTDHIWFHTKHGKDVEFVKRKKGNWAKDCACEICGFKPWYERDIHTLSFCPNCGADMRGDSNE